MKGILKQMRPFDYVFIVLALILSFVPNVITAMVYNTNTEDMQTIAQVKIDGEVVDEFPLKENGENIIETYYPNEGQYNIVEVQNEQVRIKEDNSPDQVGVKTGWISEPGQTAICLPHGFVVEVAGTQVEDDDLILPL